MGDETYSTSDIGLAAFLSLRGLALSRVDRDDGGWATFVFRNHNDAAGQLRLEYHNSECCRFDSELRHIKKLLWQ